MDYFCSRCDKPCRPMLYPAGIGADCCEEAPLVTTQDDSIMLRFLTEMETDDLIESLMDDEGPQTPRDKWLGRS